MKFNCIGCGKCCSKIRGMDSSQDTDFLKEYGYGKLPLIHLQPVEKISFPLWDWEKKRFEKWSKELKIDAKIKKSKIIFDLNSNRAIVGAYYFDFDCCPFLKENKCAVYDKKRGYVCRLFPLNKSPVLETGEEITKGIFGDCPQIEKIKKNLPKEKKEIIKYLHNIMPRELINAIQHDMISEWMNKTIIKLIKQKKLRPAMNYPYELLLKRINNSEEIGFTDFLVESGLYTKEEIEELIKKFDKNAPAIEKLKKYLD